MRRAVIRALLVGVAAIAYASCTETTKVEAESPITRVERDGSVKSQAFSHEVFDAVLAQVVDDDGMVDYAGRLQNRSDLDRYVGQLAAASPNSHPDLFPTENHEMAYWINAYNALMLRAVIDNYPIKSVTDIMVAHGVFRRLKFPVGVESMTLDDIEKGTLLERYDHLADDLHWSLTCASMGCPRLEQSAYSASGLRERLKHAGRVYLNSPAGVQINTQTGVVRIARYFDWYGDDFGDDHLGYIRPFLTEERRAALDRIDEPEIEFIDYDWRLNDAGAEWAAGRN